MYEVCYCQGGRVKTKSPLKIILITAFVLIVILGGGLFVASKKLKPEEMKKMMITQLETAIPNSKVKTTALDFSLGFNSSVDIKGVDITYAGKRSYPLVSIETLKLKIPLWSLIFGGGKVEVVLDSPKVNYIEFRKGSNWERALEQNKKRKTVRSNKSSNKPKKNTKPNTAENKEDSVLIPSLFASSEINISVLNLNLDYSLRDKTNGKIEVEKFLLKDVGVKSTTAFELKSKLDVLKNTPNHTKMNLLLIGESNLYDWFDKNEVTLNTKLILQNIKNPALRKEVSKVALNSKIKYSKAGALSVVYTIMLEESEISKGVVEGQKGAIVLKDLEISLGLKDVASYVIDPSVIPITLSGEEKLSLKGKVNLGKKVTPTLKFNIKPALTIKQGNIEVKSLLSGETTRNGLILNLENELLSGHANIDTHIKTNWTPESFKKMKPIIMNVDVRDLKVTPEIFAQEQNTAKNDKTKEDSNSKNINNKKDKKTKASPVTALAAVPLRANVNIENVDLAGAKLAGGINLKVGKTSAKLSTSGLVLDKGEITVRDSIRISRGLLRHDFEASLLNVDLSSLNGFVPKGAIEGLSGSNTGKVSGHLLGEKYFAKANFKLSDGKLSKINLENYVSGLIDKLGSIGKKVPTKKLKINGEFKTLQLKGSFDNKRHSFEKVLFKAKDNKVIISGAGNVYPLGPKNSQLKVNLNIKDPKIGASLKKEIGTTVFPMLLKGPGYVLNPDYAYTIKKVSKKAVKTQAKKEVKKQIKKIFKDNKKMKKMFKGLFK